MDYEQDAGESLERAHKITTQVVDEVARCVSEHHLIEEHQPVVVMVSGGSDSMALAYIACDLARRNLTGPVAFVHVNHLLRGEASDLDAEFVTSAAHALGVICYTFSVDIPLLLHTQGGNMEALARKERYAAAQRALADHCAKHNTPLAEGRLLVAHTQNDRVETFYMRSIVGTGPGGFRAMRYRHGQVVRPCLDVSREMLRDYLKARSVLAEAGQPYPIVRDRYRALWREDATNAHLDHLRAYVRAHMVPRALERNPRVLETLCRTMNAIADEDDYLASQAQKHARMLVKWEDAPAQACVLLPEFAREPLVLQRRIIYDLLSELLPVDTRIDQASIEAVRNCFDQQGPRSGHTDNIQGNLALSANKQGVRIEPMQAYRARRKPHKV